MSDVTGVFAPLLVFSLGYLVVFALKKTHLWEGSLSLQIHSSVIFGSLAIVLTGVLTNLLLGLQFGSVYYLLVAVGSFATVLLTWDVLTALLAGRSTSKVDLSEHRWLYLVLGSLVGGMVVLHLLLPPLRGFDALWRYFPEALVFYQTDQIPVVNYLDYRAVTYEPVNTLLYAFTLYLYQSPNFVYLPLLYVGALVLTCYNVAQLVFKDKSQQLFTTCLFLTIPLFHWLVEFFIYYQEIYVTYFFSVAVLYLKAFYDQQKGWSSLLTFYGAVSLTLLSKINGWLVLPVLILAIPTGQVGRRTQQGLAVVLWVVLSVQGASVTFVLTLLPLFLYLFAYLVSVEKSTDKQISGTKHAPLLGAVGLGIITGASWLVLVSQRLPVGSSETYGRFLKFGSPSFSFPTVKAGSELLLELSHMADMTTAYFVIFFGMAFAGIWLVAKTLGLRQFLNQKYLVAWLTAPTMVWVTHLGQTGSVRYIAFLLIPVAILTSAGVYELWRLLRAKNPSLPHNPPKTYLGLFLAAGMINFYPLIPLIFLLRWPVDKTQVALALDTSYRVNGDVLFQLILALVFLAILASYLLNYSVVGLVSRMIERKRWKRQGEVFLGFCLVILVVLAYSSPLSVLTIASGGDLESQRAFYEPAASPEYEAVVDYFIQENVLNITILTMNIPGLGFYTNIPTLDIRQERTLAAPFYANENVTDGLLLLQDPLRQAKDQWGVETTVGTPSVGYVVIPGVNHPWRPYYNTLYRDSSYLFSLLHNNLLFRSEVENDLFEVYKLVKPLPHSYIGVVDVFVRGSDNTAFSLLERQNKTWVPNPVLDIVLDLAMVPVEGQEVQLVMGYDGGSTGGLIERNLTSIDRSTFYHWTFGPTDLPPECQLTNLTVEVTGVDGVKTVALVMDGNGVGPELTHETTGWWVHNPQGFQFRWY